MTTRVPISPGGTLPPELVVGRDDLARRYCGLLGDLSLALVAPRRVGKSSVCRRMVYLAGREFPRLEFVCRDLQGERSVERFLARLYEDTGKLLSTRLKAEVRAAALLRALTGSVEYDGLKVKLPESDWRSLLERLLDDIQAWAAANDRVVVLMWDEFTWFLHDTIQAGGARDAMTLLDRLRAARQSGRNTHVRFVAVRGRTVDELASLIKVDRERILLLTERLRRDLYLARHGRVLHFRMRLLRRFWCLERFLDPDGDL